MSHREMYDKEKLLWIVEDNINCNLCNKKIFALDWLEQETIDSWNAFQTMQNIVYWINEHFREEHKELVKEK